MILDNLMLNILLLVSFLIILNRVISKTKILVDNHLASNHKYNFDKTIPLSGGIFLFSIIFYFNYNFKSELLTLLYTLPLLILGTLSDKNILNSPIARLLLQALFVFLALKFLNIHIMPDRMVFISSLLNNELLNNFFLLFCFLVLINGSNFIDGLNGLSSGYYLLIIISILVIEKNFNFNSNLENNNFSNYLFLPLSIFFLFNLFKKNFMGDNGIYFLSFYIGIKLIETYNANTSYLSPFYIASLLWYPVFENLFSIIRRLIFSKSVSSPDNLHLHALLFGKLKYKIGKKNCNTISSLIILFFSLPGFLFSTIYRNETIILCFVIVLNIILYLISYQYLKK